MTGNRYSIQKSLKNLLEYKGNWTQNTLKFRLAVFPSFDHQANIRTKGRDRFEDGQGLNLYLASVT